jgi:predicted oxidoreductase
VDAPDPFAEAEKFAALDRRWDGHIPLDDLPYLDWHRALARPDRSAFRTRALLRVVRAFGGSKREQARRIAGRSRAWFPVKGGLARGGIAARGTLGRTVPRFAMGRRWCQLSCGG